ncbi:MULTISPECIES: DUF6287 domain-containing protein [unclassified Enterococcus]|uniref:DUF6287 domain-containing protein n=1 Tax=unclassified Enterococcus TaxID=2608891 RepID=UPI00155535BB|nr:MULTISPECIES: DUF6287 domain-containing protein [unclassified Enterococcus]MBS7576778.1 hypothetical protein [Enterococcus sp. MMGLQ5-2]MBS7583735.1 hypothetical protein [Enterococcus sp. MMGLQ5-1]NPD11596.1 hypothetical protein [Enterococcus sp. MMGLQ5-1]NPD36615.1 hypothetical protein [Enterococcus sp. MMGLQ5-2]
MKKFKLFGVLLLSITILGACSSNKKKADSTKESQTSQASKKEKQASSQASESSATESIASQSTDNTAVTEQQEETAPQQQNSTNELDLDIDAIKNGDISTLVGKWENGKGEIIIIDANYAVTLGSAEGMESTNSFISPPDDLESYANAPYVNVHSGYTGFFISLFKIGFSNPLGDQSDISRPRIVGGQQAINYSPDTYYYRKQ